MADKRLDEIAKFIEPFRVAPGSKVRLERDFDPAFKAGVKKKQQGLEMLRRGVEALSEYQARLAAQNVHGVLVVLQGLDASGKDGTIRHVMSGVNPQGVAVHAFKPPSAEELSHDYLWRHQKRLPARGQIAVFNRSHYEEAVAVRVHPENLDRERVPPERKSKEIWRRRYREINDWERYLVDNGFRVVKLLLNVSKEEQRIRLLRRLDVPERNWKFSLSDVEERGYWDDYQYAFSDMLSRTSTKWAPWHVIPADRKWFARLSAAQVLVAALMEIDPHYPTLDAAASAQPAEVRARLEGEAPA
ncbi:MAG: polyphosphate kinase 2 family protein [Actinomycetota bacterium]|nr:polyphosphate kinase 2 family protein [Actinomycetota bacterium]